MEINWRLFATYYLLSSPGDEIIICDDGKIYKERDGITISEIHDVKIDRAKCIVFDAPSEDEFPCESELESLVDWDEVYVDLVTRERIGDLDDAIKYCIEFGDMNDLFNEWKEEYKKKKKERDETK